jgi:hypothetical protein
MLRAFSSIARRVPSGWGAIDDPSRWRFLDGVAASGRVMRISRSLKQLNSNGSDRTRFHGYSI